MRDFRDAKSMAQTLRESLTAKAVTISHSESLELVSKMLGVADWNTLSALLQSERRGGGSVPAPRQAVSTNYPLIPIRDLAPFPAAIFPLFIGRVKTMQALDQAFERECEVVLAVQRDPGVDQPGFDDVYEIGVLAQLLELERQGDGTLKVQVQTKKRVAIRRFAGGSGGTLEAEVTEISEGPVQDAPELIQQAIKHFKAYTAAHEIRIPQIWPLLDQTRDPGRVADIIASRMKLPLSEKQNLLMTVDAVARLTRVDALMSLPVPLPSPTLEATRRRALDYANERKHQYATLEHLLLALTDDTDVAAVLQTCKADLGALKASLLHYLDHELKEIVVRGGADARPSPAFGRVIQRATLDAQSSARTSVSGANMLLAIFPETRSPAVRFLGEQGVWPGRVSGFSGKTP